jgi:putative ABC transport system permease protein
MFRHLLLLVWQRKRANGLLLLEIFFTFLVLFVLAAAGFELAGRLGSARGYAIDDVWSIEVRHGESSSDDDWTLTQVNGMAALLREAERQPEIAAAALALTTPYELGARTSVYGFESGAVETEANEVSDGFAEVLGLELVAGRWFAPEDDALGYEPLVIDRDLARTLYGNADPVGQRFGDDDGARVIGVVRDYRRSELQAAGNYLFERVRVGNLDDRPPSRLLVRVQAGTTTAFQEELVRRLRQVMPEWSYEINALVDVRRAALRLRLAPLLAGAVIALFLLVMVALGLAGVVYQNLAQRTREIGLRRALGAAAPDVRVQLLGELLVLTALALAAGSVLVLQLPVLVPFLSLELAAIGLGLATLGMLALVLVAGWVPATLATRLDPSSALRYE